MIEDESRWLKIVERQWARQSDGYGAYQISRLVTDESIQMLRDAADLARDVKRTELAEFLDRWVARLATVTAWMSEGDGPGPEVWLG